MFYTKMHLKIIFKKKMILKKTAFKLAKVIVIWTAEVLLLLLGC